MDNLTTDPKYIVPAYLSTYKLRAFFINQLNKVYCAKSHLAERLPEIELQSHFSELKPAIRETLEDVNLQLIRMNEIYTLLKIAPTIDNSPGMVGMIEDAYSDIHKETNDQAPRDLSILFYMQIIKSVEIASFQVLQLAAIMLKNKQIEHLIFEIFDKAKNDRALLLQITAKYVNG